MEAATPLNPTRIRLAGSLLLIDGLALTDEATVRVAHDRVEAGEGLTEVVTQAIEIGARVLDRESTSMHADFVKAEFERTARELEREFVDKARIVNETLGQRIDAAFGADAGVVPKLLEKHFGDASSSAVQHQVRGLVVELLTAHKEALVKQFNATDGSNPLAQFQQGAIGAIKHASDQQQTHLHTMNETIVALKAEVAALKAEREKDDAVAIEADKGTGKGRTYEEQVATAIAQLAHARGDLADAVGDRSDVGRSKKGDVVVDLGAQLGASLGRIAFEAKDKRLSQPDTIRELDGALAARNADFAVLVVPTEAEVPARMEQLVEFHGDKLIVVWDPQDGSTLTLDCAYRLARARVLMARDGADDVIDAAAIAQLTERALQELKDFRKVRSNLTAARKGIDDASGVVDAIERSVKLQLDEISVLVQPQAA